MYTNRVIFITTICIILVSIADYDGCAALRNDRFAGHAESFRTFGHKAAAGELNNAAHTDILSLFRDEFAAGHVHVDLGILIVIVVEHAIDRTVAILGLCIRPLTAAADYRAILNVDCGVLGPVEQDGIGVDVHILKGQGDLVRQIRCDTAIRAVCGQVQLTLRSSAVGDGDIAVILLDIQARQMDGMAFQIKGALEGGGNRCRNRLRRRSDVFQNGDHNAFARCCCKGLVQGFIVCGDAVLCDGSHINHRFGNRSINGDAIVTRFRHAQIVPRGNGGIVKGIVSLLDFKGLVRREGIGIRDVGQQFDDLSTVSHSCSGGKGRIIDVVHLGHWLADGEGIVRIGVIIRIRHWVETLGAVRFQRRDGEEAAGD